MAQAVTSVAGSSDWFERGYVTYSNAAKREALGVRGRRICSATARSASRPRARWRAARSTRSRGTIALSITGIAGPGGGSPGKPVGTVCFAWARGRKIRSETKRFRGGRSSVRRQSVIHALRGVLKWL